jgi:hypothetical protein
MVTLAERVSLANGARIRGGLLANAYPLPPGWENGVSFLGVGCQEPAIVGPCVITDRTETRPGDASIFEPIFVNQSAGCSMLSHIGEVNIAANRLESTTEWALGRALATGVGSNNPALADAENISSVSDPANVGLSAVQAVSCLEQAAADVGFGAEVFLHAPLRAAAYLANAGMMTEDYMSPSGFQWIISPGYPVEGDDVTIWATGSVFASVTPAEALINGATGQAPQGWRTNSGAAYAQRLGLAAFDPCLNLSATFTVPACTGGS